ncbi:MAG: hypothetical protein QOC77_961 [Thermoleophilaceae bacterium]|jgi:hypothetical protein|nr:hypothetical protein [Thermoleophilaceae bacterium]
MIQVPHLFGRRGALPAALGVSIALVAAPGAFAASPLTGETFSGPAQTTTTAACDFSQATESFSFNSTGTASGPYAGTYSESGTVTLNTNEDVVGFDATFTIASPSGNVQGSKSFGPQTVGGSGFCGPSGTENSVGSATGLSYTAQITAPDGTFNDTGLSNAQVESFFAASGRTGTLSEDFTSTGFGSAGGPNAKSACKKGGFNGFAFKNQGQCVKSVNQNSGG